MLLLPLLASLALAGPGLSREDLIQQVLEVNPAVDAAAHAVDAARARVRVRGAWPDPTVSASLAPLSLTDANPGVAVGVSQALPISGRKGLDRAAARIEAAIAEEDVHQVRLELALAASRLFDDYWLAEQALALNAEHRALVVDLQQSARTRYAVGRVPEAAPLTAELTLLQLEEEAIALEAQRDAIVAALSGLLHREPAPLPPPVDPPAPAALPEAPAPDRPDLRVLEHEEALAELQERSARRLWTPEPTLMTEYSTMWDEVPHRWMVGVALDVPLQVGPRRGAVDAARAERARASAARERALEEARVEVQQAWLAADAARRTHALAIGRLLPVAEERLRAARIAFEADRADFDAIIEAERALLQAQLTARAAVADHHRALAALAVASGRLPIRGEQ